MACALLLILIVAGPFILLGAIILLAIISGMRGK